MPGLGVKLALARRGMKVRRASKPSKGPAGPNYSKHDPVESIEAAYDHHDRRASQTTKVLMLLLSYAKDPNPWVPLKDILRVGGSEGDKRGRELRGMGWPIEKQIVPGRSWNTRINLNGISPRVLRGAKNRSVK
jgi:hypothetical protein